MPTKSAFLVGTTGSRNLRLQIVYKDIKWSSSNIEGSEKYADYRKQLISRDELQTNRDTFCEQAGRPTTAKKFNRLDDKQAETNASHTDGLNS